MIRKFLLITSLIAIPAVTAASAQAREKEHCREYTKTVSINGRAERAYGTACYRGDGSWEIVSLEGKRKARERVRDVMYDDIEKYSKRRDYRNDYRDDGRVIIVESYHRNPRYYRPHHRHHSVRYDNHWPFVIHWNAHGGRHYKYDRKRVKKTYSNVRYHRGHKHDRGHYKGHGRSKKHYGKYHKHRH